MKKYISMFVFAILGTCFVASCDPETDEEPGGTAVEKVAGFWDVTVDVIDTIGGEVAMVDPYGVGSMPISTFNTAANTTDSLWLEDGSFWGVKMKVGLNYGKAQFTAENVSYDPTNPDAGNVVALQGKVLYGQARNEHGQPTDSIVIDVKYDDDTYGFTYRYSGRRHSGF